MSIQAAREKIAQNTGALLAANTKLFESIQSRYSGLKAKGGAHPADFRRLQNEARGWLTEFVARDSWNPSTDQPAYDGALAWCALLDAEIDLLAVGAKLVEQGGGEPGWIDAISGKPIRLLAPNERITPEGPAPKATVGTYLNGLLTGPRTDAIRAALSEGTDSAGGYSIPLEVTSEFFDRLRARTRFIQAGAKTLVLNGAKTRIMRVATDPQPAWRAENASVAESDPTFEGVDLAPKSLAVLVKVSAELLADSANVEAALQEALLGALSVELDRAALFGSGASNQPLGLFGTTNVNTVSLGANGATPTADDLLSALYECELDNAQTPTAIIYHPRTAQTFRKAKNGQGDYLRQPEDLAPIPRLATTSVPITQTQGTSSNCSTILMGDFTQAILGLRQELRIQVLDQPFMGNLQVGFIAHLRADVAFAHPEAFCRIIGVKP